MNTFKLLLFILIFVLFVVCIASTIWFEIPVVETIQLPSAKTDNSMQERVRFALVTDLHSCRYGKDMEKLVALVESANVDAILLAGDIFDDKRPNGYTKRFLEQVAKKYPCYYATGNHEFMCRRVRAIKSYLKEIGVAVLSGDCIQAQFHGRTFDICGIDDPVRIWGNIWFRTLQNTHAKTNPNHFRILISHRPELVNVYSQFDFDMVVSGHAHGGQWFIPLLNRGILAPNQGLFPKYVNGLYTLKNGTRLIVSRGLAREKAPFPRFGNHPEIVVIEL